MASPSSDKATPPGSSSVPRLQAGPLEPWTIREKLCLASAVRHNGDQNWLTVSKSMKPFLDPHRPAERFAPKNAAMQYANLLEGVEPPKRVKRGDGPSRDSATKETPEDIVVRKLTFQRIEELKRIVAAEKDRFTELKRQQEMLRKGLLDEKLPEMWAEVVAKKRAAEEADAALKFANEEAARAAQDAQFIRETSSAGAIPSSSISVVAAASTSEMAVEPATASVVASSFSSVVQALVPPPVGAATPAAACAAMLEEAVSETTNVEMKDSENDEVFEIKTVKPRSSVFNPEDWPSPEHQETEPTQTKTQSEKEPKSCSTSSTIPPATILRDIGVEDEPVREKEVAIEPVREREVAVEPALEPISQLNDDEDDKKVDNAQSAPQSLEVKKEILASSESCPHEVNVATIDDSNSAESMGADKEADEVGEEKPTTDPELQPEDEKPDAATPLTTSTEIQDKELLHPVEEEAASEISAPIPKISTGPEVTLEDIEKHRKSDKLASKKDTKKPTTVVVVTGAVDENIGEAAEGEESSEKENTPAASSTKKTEVDEDIEEPIEQRILEDSESEADALEASSDVHDLKAPPSILSGATPSESETEDTFSNAASPRADGRGRLRHAGSDFGSSIAGPTSSCPNSPASISQSSDIEADEKAHRAWKKSIMLVWRNASHHKYANLFVNPVTDEIAPGYSVVIKRPIDLKTIKSKVDNGQISNTAEFQRDFMLMFTNAIMYNNSDQDIFAMTNEMYRDVLEDIEQFVSTQLYVQAALASSNASESASSPAVAPSSSRLRGRTSRSQKQQQQDPASATAAASVTTEEAAIEGESKAAGTSTPTPASKRRHDDSSTKSKKRRSHRID